MRPEEIQAMNERIAQRREQAVAGRFVPIQGPRWASEVVDTGDEILAIHKDTGEPYPLDPHADLSIEEHAVVVLQRMILAGAGTEELERVVRAFGLPSGPRARLLWHLREP